MINVKKLVKVSKLADNESANLATSFRKNTFAKTISRTKLFKEEERLQKLREDTFFSLSKALGEKDKRGGLTGALLGVLGLGGAGRAVRRFGGGGGGGLRGGTPPKLPKGPLAKSLSKFGRIGPLAIASTGLDFFARKQSGQSNLQAGGGALAGLGGFAGGAKLGALLGTAILPGVGTAVGGLLGGALGGMIGGNLFDRLYGQDRLRAGADFRRVEEIERTRQQSTLFGENLDKLDIVLDKFEKKAPIMREEEEERNIIGERIRRSTEGVPVKNRPNALMKIIDTIFGAAAIVYPPAVTKKVGIKKTLANILMSKKARSGSKFLEFSRSASKIKPETLAERMTRAFKKNFGNKFNPSLSKKGKLIREGNKILEQEKNSNRLAKIFKFIRVDPSIAAKKGKLSKKVTRKLLNKKKLEEAVTAESKIFKSGQEADSIAEIVKKVLREGDIGSANLTKREKDLFNAFKISIDDMIDAGFIDNKNVDELIKFLKRADTGGEGINFQKVIKQLKETPLGADILKNSEGGVMSGPESGYLAVLHGRERIIPEENQYTRSKGAAQNMKTNTIMMVENNKGRGSTGMMGSPKSEMVPIFVASDPFDVATKYSELIAKVTV